MKRRGFTLIEVSIAIAITAFIGLVIGMSFNSTIQNKDIIEGQAEHYRMLRAGAEKVSVTCPPPPAPAAASPRAG